MKKTKKINGFARDFVSVERREYQYKIGNLIASALAGFLAGVIFTSITLSVAIYYISTLAKMAK